MLLKMSNMLRSLQDALQLDDKQMADYLMVSESNFKEARAGNEGSDELPLHAKVDVLDTLGFVGITDFGMIFLTKRQREKLKQARARRAVSIAQEKALKMLKKQLQDERKKG